MSLSISTAAEKPRIFVLTDIKNEPDDAMSMVRFLTYANHFDIEGLAATTSIHQQNRIAPERIRRIAEAYDKVRDNLEKSARIRRLETSTSSSPRLGHVMRLTSATKSQVMTTE